MALIAILTFDTALRWRNTKGPATEGGSVDLDKIPFTRIDSDGWIHAFSARLFFLPLCHSTFIRILGLEP